MPEEQRRSGDFSQDPGFDPEQLFSVIGREENTHRATQAICVFLERGDRAAFERAIALFVRSARARNDPVERVLAVLIELATEREGAAPPHNLELSELRRLILRGVLLAFFGDSPVRVAVANEEP